MIQAIKLYPAPHYPALNFTPFTGMLCCWNGEKTYLREKRRLDGQVERMLSLQGGLAQTSQGNPEDWAYRFYLEGKVKQLQRSVKKALLMEED